MTLQLTTPQTTGATEYGVSIAMEQDTVTKLTDGGYSLHAFKAVQAPKGGQPLLWFQTADILSGVAVEWVTQYKAYISTSRIIPGGTVTAKKSELVTPGDTWSVDRAGAGVVTQDGPSTAVTIQNTSDREFTAGLAEEVINNEGEPTANPMCAFPLYGGHALTIAPLARVLLMFSTESVDTGTVIYKSVGPSLLVDLTSQNLRTVTYDINRGWGPADAAWAKRYPSKQQLSPLLIETPQPAQVAAFERRTLVA